MLQIRASIRGIKRVKTGGNKMKETQQQIKTAYVLAWINLADQQKSKNIAEKHYKEFMTLLGWKHNNL